MGQTEVQEGPGRQLDISQTAAGNQSCTASRSTGFAGKACNRRGGVVGNRLVVLDLQAEAGYQSVMTEVVAEKVEHSTAVDPGLRAAAEGRREGL